MSAELRAELLAQVTTRVLEDSAFLFVERAGPDAVAHGLQARIGFQGERRGRLVLTASAGLAGLIAAGMLGQEAPEPAAGDSGPQALGELANVVVGALAVRLFGPEALVQIGIPEVGPEQAGPPGAVQVTLQVEDGGLIGVAATLEG